MFVSQMTPLADLFAHINNETMYDNRTATSGTVTLLDYSDYDPMLHEMDKVFIRF